MTFTAWRVNHRQLFFSPMLPSNALVFDIGANHGEYTASFLSIGARVVAVEPQPDVAKTIIDAFPSEIQSGALVVRTQAVGSEKGVGKLFPGPDSWKTMSSLSTRFVEISAAGGEWSWNQAQAFEVPIVTLDSLIEEYGTPDYIKIDVEGFDIEVLCGLSKPVRLLSFEFNTQPGLLELAERCINQVASLSEYYEFNYQAEAPGMTSLQFDKWIPASVMLYTLRYDAARSILFGDIFARRKGV